MEPLEFDANRKPPQGYSTFHLLNQFGSDIQISDLQEKDTGLLRLCWSSTLLFLLH